MGESSVPAVLLIIFRRKATALEVLGALRAVRAPVLYIAADGPRAHKKGEDQICAETRQAILDGIDWPCRVETLFRPANMGIRYGIPEAITWFLQREGEGIILEDDCLPSQDFFRFASACLEKYRNDPRVMHISGSSFRFGKRYTSDSYTFSRYNHGWGWATWKRAWDLFDGELVNWPQFLCQADQCGFWESKKERKYWVRIANLLLDRQVDTWDYQWKFTLWSHGAYCLYPESNMVKNLGFGDHATNTFNGDSEFGNRPFVDLGNLTHPAFVMRHRKADHAAFMKMYWGTPRERVFGKLKKVKNHLVRRFG